VQNSIKACQRRLPALFLPEKGKKKPTHLRGSVQLNRVNTCATGIAAVAAALYTNHTSGMGIVA